MVTRAGAERPVESGLMPGTPNPRVPRGWEVTQREDMPKTRVVELAHKLEPGLATEATEATEISEISEKAEGYVVIGYDGSPPSVAAFRFGREYAHKHGLVVRVVSVEQPDSSPHEAVPADQLAALTHLVPDGPPVEISQVVGHPAEELLRLSAGAQLLVVGSRGHGGLSLGSVSLAVLLDAAGPVCIVR